MDELQESAHLLFDERRRFIVIGLTGRTGSGCTSAASILSSEFDQLPLSKDIYKNSSNAEQLRHQIVYAYLKENWSKYHVIRMKDIITSFILEENFEQFITFCAEHLERERESFADNFSGFLKSRFDATYRDRQNVKYMLLDDKESALASNQVYNFYFKDLPLFTDNVKQYLDELTPNGFTTVYQKIGNNVRTSGTAYSSDFNPKNIFLLPQRVNVPIKILRRRSIDDKSRVLVVIDSIRNPYEAKFFQERYSAFYLFAVTTSNDERKRRLSLLHYNDLQINQLDEVEYPEKLVGYKKLTSINVQQCIQESDVHIYNPKSKGSNHSQLAWGILKYVALINHPGLINPTAEERLMQLAYNAKLSSGCISRQVGAVVTDKDLSVKAIGWNDVPSGQTPCVLRNANWLLTEENLGIFSKYEIEDEKFRSAMKHLFEDKLNSTRLEGCNISYCFKDIKNYVDGEKNQVHTRALHAEENAFLQISKYGGTGVQNGYLFTTASPCELCSKKAYQIGISTILYIDPYPGISEKHIFGTGKDVPQLKLFEGAIGHAFQQLFNPIMPHKDIIDLLVNIDIPSKKRVLEKEIADLRQALEEKEAEIASLRAD